jgi:ribosomal protein S18 acetylase RimI-like enzyme
VEAVVVLDHHDREVARRIRDLQRAAYAVEAELIGFDQMPPLVEDVDDITGLTLTILGWVVGSDLWGVLGYLRTGDVVDIDRLAVHPSRFRRGVGRSLMEALDQREPDARRFEVSTGAANSPAIELYRGLDYEPIRYETVQGVRVVHLVRTGD